MNSLSSATRMRRPRGRTRSWPAASSRSPCLPLSLSPCLVISRCPAHHPVDRLQQLVLLDRLEQVGVDPLLAEPGQVAGAVPGSQQDDGGGGQLGPLPDVGGQGQAVRVGHPGVEQHQRVRPAAGRAVPEGIHRRDAVAHRHRLHLPAAQPLLQDVTVGGVVIDDQHRQVVQQDRWRRSRRLGEDAADARIAP